MTLASKRRIDSSQTPEKSAKKIKMQNLIQGVPIRSEFVIMPWDDTREIISSKGGTIVMSTRWELIQRQLCASTQILNCNDLINVIKSYNIVFEKNGKQTLPSWKCLVLQKYFMTLDSSQIKNFFQENGILSTIRILSLQLKELVPKLELLKTGVISTIKLHQMQIASLLANAFFCTFPKGKADCPSFNFNTLYESNSSSVMNYNIEKIKCIMHYFSRIHKKKPTGHLSFHRLCIPDHKFPRWDKTTVELSSLKVDAKGKIEDQEGFLQMDFANRYVGGGVLGRGCVQEEIRFIICPELIASRLFTESLADNEALFVVGAERYCSYTGYSSTFKFAGDYLDLTPCDESGSRKSFLIIVDALYFHRSSEQFRESKILRELKKAYVGFKPLGDSNPLPLATGNWGCGAFGGDPQLKSILQLMASSQARRNMLYLTFGDVLLKKQIEELYQVLKEHSVNVGMLYRIIRMYNKERRNNQSVFEFVREAISKIENKNSFSKFDSPTCSPPSPSSPSSSAAFVSTHQSMNNISTSEEFSNFKTEFRQVEGVKEEDLNFPDMEMDFEALDEEIENRSNRCRQSINEIEFPDGNKSIPLDVIWFENEVGSAKRIQPAGERQSMDQREVEEIPSDGEEERTAEDFGSFQKKNSVEEEEEKKKSIPEKKKLIQKKITDCFSKR